MLIYIIFVPGRRPPKTWCWSLFVEGALPIVIQATLASVILLRQAAAQYVCAFRTNHLGVCPLLCMMLRLAHALQIPTGVSELYIKQVLMTSQLGHTTLARSGLATGFALPLNCAYRTINKEKLTREIDYGIVRRRSINTFENE